MKILSLQLFAVVFLLQFSLEASATQTCRTIDLLLTAPAENYQVNSNGTVRDKSTGLIWKRCSEGQSGEFCETGKAMTYNWDDAKAVASQSSFAGEKDWRLPAIRELGTLLEYQCTMPAINLAVFPATPATNFWSITPYAGYVNGAWNLNFNDGVHDNSSKNYRLYVRLVRGGVAAQGEGK